MLSSICYRGAVPRLPRAALPAHGTAIASPALGDLGKQKFCPHRCLSTETAHNTCYLVHIGIISASRIVMLCCAWSGLQAIACPTALSSAALASAGCFLPLLPWGNTFFVSPQPSPSQSLKLPGLLLIHEHSQKHGRHGEWDMVTCRMRRKPPEAHPARTLVQAH